MIKAFIGTNFRSRNTAMHAYIESLGEVQERKIEGENLTKEILDETLGAQSLFGERQVVVIEEPAHTMEAWKVVSSALKDMQESDTVFVIAAEALSAPRLKEVSRYADVEEYQERSKKQKTSPIAFKLTDAFLKKDKKSMWMRYQEALLAGEEPEALHGALFWQVKNIALAHECESASEAGVAPFVFSKAKAGTRVYEQKEITFISHELVELYHNSRESGEDLSENLERWILNF